MSRKHKILTLAERVAVLKVDQGMSCCAIAIEVGVGKTEVQNIVKERDEIMKQWESRERSDKKYGKTRAVGYEDLDKIVWEWLTIARGKNIPVSGKMIQEKALMFAEGWATMASLALMAG